jgi:uncharacterized protein YjbJ (UPF0337 family)
MNSSNTDKVEGKLHEVKGNLKKAVGNATNNPELTKDGQAEKIDGQVQSKIGEIKKVFRK